MQRSRRTSCVHAAPSARRGVLRPHAASREFLARSISLHTGMGSFASLRMTGLVSTVPQMPLALPTYPQNLPNADFSIRLTRSFSLGSSPSTSSRVRWPCVHHQSSRNTRDGHSDTYLQTLRSHRVYVQEHGGKCCSSCRCTALPNRCTRCRQNTDALSPKLQIPVIRSEAKDPMSARGATGPSEEFSHRTQHLKNPFQSPPCCQLEGILRLRR
jgi:hypothetical protein